MSEERIVPGKAEVIDFRLRVDRKLFILRKKAIWNEIYAERISLVPLEDSSYCFQQLAISTSIDRTTKIDWQLKGVSNSDRVCQKFEHQFDANSCTILPPGAELWLRPLQKSDVGVIALESEFIERVARETFNDERVEIVHRIGVSDDVLHNFGRLFQAELYADNANGQLYIESLASAIVIHLLKNYSALKKQIVEPKGGLTTNAIRQILDYINDRLEENLSLLELAAVVRMSPHYFSALFKQSIGISPYQYVIRCRVQRAEQLLRQGKQTIAEIAKQVGFAHQSHLNYHFKRHFGVTPKTIVPK
jgi:AraC family transcriptional regulator